MKIEPFADHHHQRSHLGRHRWSVARLIELSRDFPVMEIPIDHLNIFTIYDKLTMREMVGHFLSVQRADLSCPIILDEDGELMDGRHRIMRALIEGKKSIRAVRFDENPEPCERVD